MGAILDASLTFPDDKNMPAKEAKRALAFLVPIHIACSLSLPESSICCRYYTAIATAMLVPETAMNKNNLSQARKNKVGLSGQIFAMKAKTKTHCMNQPANNHLRFCVLPANGGHAAAALLRSKNIRHILEARLKRFSHLADIGEPVFAVAASRL